MKTFLRRGQPNVLPNLVDEPYPVEVVCLVPAHNEEEQIAATIDSLIAQTIPVKIIVSADNCTDRTVEIARSYPGVIVRKTVDNKARKAGALNQAWRAHATDADYVFTMDASFSGAGLPEGHGRRHWGSGSGLCLAIPQTSYDQ